MDNIALDEVIGTELSDFVYPTDDTELLEDDFPVEQIVTENNFPVEQIVSENASQQKPQPRQRQQSELSEATTEVASEDEYMKQLSDLLENGQEAAFVTQLSQRRPEDLSQDVGGLTLLQRAARGGLAVGVCALLNAGADPNAATPSERRAPLVLAAAEGRWAALQTLLKGAGPSLDVDAADARGDSALHLAARAAQLDAVVLLLRRGADARRRNLLGHVPFGREAEARALLDRCVSCRGDDGGGGDFEIAFDYRLLAPGPPAPTGRRLELLCPGPEPLSAEMDFIVQLIEGNGTLPLLGHPVVASFLECKWSRMRTSAYLAFVFKMLYVLLIDILVVCSGMGMHTYPWRYFSYIGVGTAGIGFIYMIVFNVWCDIFMCLAFALSIACGIVIALKEDIILYIVLAVLCSCLIVLLEFDRLPIFAYQLQLIKFVAKQYLLFLIPFILIILTLSLGVHLILLSVNGRISISKNNFESWSISVVQTVLMVAKSDTAPYPPSILFYLYSLIIACSSVILLNILVGLTLSCMQQMDNLGEEIKLFAKARKAYEAEQFYMRRTCSPWCCFIPFLTPETFLFPSSETERIGRASLNGFNNVHLVVGGNTYTMSKNILLQGVQIVKEEFMRSSANDNGDSTTLQQLQERITVHLRNVDEKVQERIRYLETKFGVFFHRQDAVLQSSLRSVDNRIESILAVLDRRLASAE